MYILWAIVAFIGGSIVFLIISGISSHITTVRKLRKMASDRDVNEAREYFIRYLLEFPRDLVEDVYSDLQFFIAVKKFPLLPEDNLADEINITLCYLDEFFDDKYGDILGNDELPSTLAGELARSILQKLVAANVTIGRK